MNDHLNEDTEKKPERHRSFVQTQNHCPLCKTALVIETEQAGDRGDQMQESASCPKCHLVARVKDFTLQ